MTITSTPTHLPQASVGAGPPGDSAPVVTEIVLVDTVLTDTVSLVTAEKDPEGVTVDGLALSGPDEACVDKLLEPTEGVGTAVDSEPVAAQESRVLPDGPVNPGGKGLLAGGAPYVGNITEGGPVGVDTDRLISLLAEGTLEISVVADDGFPVESLETGPEDEVVLMPVSLEDGPDGSTELLEPCPAVVTELEAGGLVAVFGGSELLKLASPEELATCDDAVPTPELERVVPADGGIVVVGCALGGPVDVPGLVDIPDDGGNEEPGRPADGDEALSDNTPEDVEAVMEEEMPELVTFPVNELEGSSLTPLDAKLVGRLEMVPCDAELGGPVMETIRLSLLLRIGVLVDSNGVESPGDEADTVPSVDVSKPGVAVLEIELPDAVVETAVPRLVLRLGTLADSDAGTVSEGEVDAVLAVEDGDRVSLSLLLVLDSTSELTVPLTDPEGTEDIPLDAGLEVVREDCAETSLGLKDDPLGVGRLDTTALETGLLVDKDSVYGPPVDDALDAVVDELIVQVSTLVVVRSVIWEVDKFVAIVVTRLVVIVMGRLEARLTVFELSTGRKELWPEDDGSAGLVFEDEGDAELSRVGGVDPDDHVSVGGTSEPGVVERLGELGELGGLELDVAAEVEILDKTVPEDDTATEEASLELCQKVSASGHM